MTLPTKAVTRVLLLSAVDPSSTALGGRAMLSRANLVLLRDMLGNRLLHVRPPRCASSPHTAWRGRVDGVDTALIADLIRRIDKGGVTRMFVDGSNYGAAVAAVKRARPQVRVVTFFHNVEARFFWGAMRARRSLKSVAVLVANFIAERMAVRHSDVLVTLSDRDSAGLRRLYGRGADALAPLVMEDRAPAPLAAKARADPYLLFVGGGFYANVAGIRWFAREVSPRIDLPVKVVGRDMDALAAEFTHMANVELVGAVDDLAHWYAGAALIIAPIFDGSGMKTKVAEALMHGKHVAGTPEAFSGYADDVVAANRLCADAEDFVVAAREAVGGAWPRWDGGMRALYERDHSPVAARVRMAALLDVPVDSCVVSEDRPATPMGVAPKPL